MHILLLRQFYPPEPTPLGPELATTLQAKGHQVTVLTGFPNYPTGKLYPGYRLRPWMKEVLEGISVVRVPLYPDHGRSALKRVLNYVSFALSGSLLGPFIVPKPDVIFVYHPPLTVGAIAWVLHRLWRVPFLYQIQDMWPETLEATGMLTNLRILNMVGRFAKRVYAEAGAIAVISPGFRDNLIQKGVPSRKIVFIPNWVDIKVHHPAPRDPQLAEDLDLANTFNVMFAGNVGEAQGLETVLEAAELLRDLPEARFVIVGDGIAMPRLRAEVEARHLDNVRFLGRYPAGTMPALYALADVLLVHLKDDPLFRITIPHKILSYMASGKPVLAAVAGDAADVVLEVGAGIHCPPQDPAALAQAVRDFYGMTAAERQSMAECGLRAAHEKYDRDILVGQIEAVLEQLVAGQNTTGEAIHVSSLG
ncbi:MAG: glycosyltransferase family 4 protein [Anaerolineae bacterium]|nr:glycosyltransferase family 4 protein [Anaerolineae bacterium]